MNKRLTKYEWGGSLYQNREEVLNAAMEWHYQDLDHGDLATLPLSEVSNDASQILDGLMGAGTDRITWPDGYSQTRRQLKYELQEMFFEKYFL